MSKSLFNNILTFCINNKKTDYKLDEFVAKLSANHTPSEIEDAFSDTSFLFQKIESFDARTLNLSQSILISITVLNFNLNFFWK
jgi:hypothetical protein